MIDHDGPRKQAPTRGTGNTKGALPAGTGGPYRIGAVLLAAVEVGDWSAEGVFPEEIGCGAIPWICLTQTRCAQGDGKRSLR
jgi:hypothetical protein